MSYSMDIKWNNLHLRAPQSEAKASGCIYTSEVNRSGMAVSANPRETKGLHRELRRVSRDRKTELGNPSG